MMHQQSPLTAVRKVYARKVTSMVSPFSGSVLQFPVVDRQWEQWCELQSERYSMVARGGKKLEVTAENLKWHIEQRYDEIEDKDGHEGAMKMYLRDEAWDVRNQELLSSELQPDRLTGVWLPFASEPKA